MKLKIKDNFHHKLIFDGNEDDYYTFSILKGEKINQFKSIYHLKKQYDLDLNSFDELINGCNGSRIKPFETFKTKDNFTIMYKLIDSKKEIIVLSTGEFQPGRYKIYLEGVWEVQ